MVLTDRFDVLNLLEASVGLNPSLNVRAAELSWGESCSAFKETEFDYIVASEVIYNGLLYEKLLQSIKELMGEKTQMIMSFERRSSEDKWMAMVKDTFEEVDLQKIVVKEKEISILKCGKLKKQQ